MTLAHERALLSAKKSRNGSLLSSSSQNLKIFNNNNNNNNQWYIFSHCESWCRKCGPSRKTTQANLVPRSPTANRVRSGYEITPRQAGSLFLVLLGLERYSLDQEFDQNTSGIRKTFTGYEMRLLPGKRDLQKFRHGRIKLQVAFLS